MINDLRARGLPANVVMVSEYDKRDLKQELMAMGEPLSDTDEDVIGFIQGCMVVSHPDVPRGKARIIKYEANPIPGMVH